MKGFISSFLFVGILFLAGCQQAQPVFTPAEIGASATSTQKIAEPEATSIPVTSSEPDFIPSSTSASNLANPPDSLVRPTWQLESYTKGLDALVSSLPGAPVTVVFGPDGVLSGLAGCNQYRSRYSVNGQQLSIQLPAATKKACAEPPGVMLQETDFLNLLAQAAGFRIDGSRLHLLDQDGKAILSFTDQP